MPVKKDRKPGRPSKNRDGLSRDGIVQIARRLMLEEGRIPSIRRIASELDADAMALYHYFSSKEALLEAVTVSLIENIYQPVESADWTAELTELCRSYLRLLGDHPGLLETMLSVSVEGPAQVFADRLAVALAPLRLSEEILYDALALLADYLHGFALAMQCDRGANGLTVEMTDGPLGLYIHALTSMAH